MTEGITAPSANVTQKLSAEGADLLTLAGVNDANLIELSRLCGVKVALRGDTLSIVGAPEFVDRAVEIGERMIELARQRVPLTPDDVLRLGDAENRGDDGDAAGGGFGGRIALPGVRKVVQAKTAGQAEYLKKIADNDIVIGIGPAGTGKTYLAVAAAVDALNRKRVRRIVLARPAVERMQKFLETRVIEVAPLAFMRGRTLGDAFVIVDEAQNATAMQMKMLLTRLGVNSRMVITGDKTQVDLPNKEESGLMQVERILKGIDGIEFHYFQEADVVRHRLVRDIIRAYDAD